MKKNKMPRRRLGRPPKPATERKRNRLQVTFTDEELRALRSLVPADQSVGTFARELILASVRRRLTRNR